MFLTRIPVKTFAFDAFCVNCRSSQSLEPCWVGISTNPIGRSPGLEFWSVALCESCRREKIVRIFNERLTAVYSYLVVCGLGLFLCWLGWAAGPVKPPPGYRWTIHAQGFYTLMSVAPYMIGYAAVITLPLFLGWWVRLLHARKGFQKTGRGPSEMLDKIYAASAKDRLRAACAETGTPPPGAGPLGGEFEVFGAGSTPESTLNLDWAKVFLRQHPERKAEAAEACDRKLHSEPLHFFYFTGLSSLLLITAGILDLQNPDQMGLLVLAGILPIFPAAVLVVLTWTENGLGGYRKIFKKGLLGSRSLRRFWGAILFSIGMIALAVPVYRYGIRKNPIHYYTQKNDDLGWRVRVEYPRDWARRKNKLIIKLKPEVSIKIFPEPDLPNDPGAAHDKIKAYYEGLPPRDPTIESWRIRPLILPGGAGWEVEERVLDIRIFTVYVPAPKGWCVFRYMGGESEPSNEEAFRRVLLTARVSRS